MKPHPLKAMQSLQRRNALPENPDATATGRFPKWLHRTLPKGNNSVFTTKTMHDASLHTVCEEAKCPNRAECFSKKTATFLALGKQCTRACGFCDIDFSKNPSLPDPKEPEKIAKSAQMLQLSHVVVTMVARDDLDDSGATHIAEIIHAIRNRMPHSTIEVLTSDFNGNAAALSTVLKARPDVFNHNMESIRRLTPKVRHTATYERSLALLAKARYLAPNTFIKSGCMVGLGETKEEVFSLLDDLAHAGVDIVTIGQYLQASKHKLPVHTFVTQDTFDIYRFYGTKKGIENIYSAPFVRSSYNADNLLQKAKENYGSIKPSSHR